MCVRLISCRCQYQCMDMDVSVMCMCWVCSMWYHPLMRQHMYCSGDTHSFRTTLYDMWSTWKIWYLVIIYQNTSKNKIDRVCEYGETSALCGGWDGMRMRWELHVICCYACVTQCCVYYASHVSILCVLDNVDFVQSSASIIVLLFRSYFVSYMYTYIYT